MTKANSRSVVRKLSIALAAAVVLTLAAAPRAQSDDCKACERFLSFLPQYSLAGSVAAIGTVALHREGAQFDVDAQLADSLKRQVAADTRIPEGCRDWVASTIKTGPRVSLTVSGSYGANGLGAKPAPFSMSYDRPSTLMGMYNSMVAAYNPCTSQRGQSGYVNCLKTNGPAAYQNFSQAMANGTTNQLITQLAGLGWGASASDIGILKDFNAALHSGDSAGLMSWAKGASKRLGTDGFLNAVQMLGWSMNNSYNFARADGNGPATHGIVTVDQALSSLKTDAMYMINGYNDEAMAIADYKVICRDAAVLQAQVLRAGGFPNSYEVTYRSSGGGGHVDVITQDPNDRTKLYTLNWYGRATHQGQDGSEALFQGNGSGIPDYSMNYVISSPDGRNVGDVPSNMMKFVNEVAGGDNAVWDQLHRTNNSIIAATVSPDPKGLVQIRAVYGADGNGATYAGAAASVHWGAGTHFPGEAGIFVGQQFRPADVYGTSKDGTLLIGYGQAVQHAITPAVKLGEHATAVLDTHVAIAADVNHIMSGPDYATGPTAVNTNGDFTHRIGTEIRVDQNALNGKLNAQYVLGGSAMIGQSDVRNADPSSYTAVPLNMYVGARATVDVGAVKLFGQTMVVLDQMGARDKVEVGVATRGLAVSTYEAGRITNGTALVQDNSLRRVGLSITAQPNKWLRLGVNGEIPVEGSDPVGGARVYGTAAVTF